MIDLATARETLAYMQDDMKRVPGLEKVADALASAIREMDAADHQVEKPLKLSPFAARFLPRRH
jgi:hypothetical protein